MGYRHPTIRDWWPSPSMAKEHVLTHTQMGFHKMGPINQLPPNHPKLDHFNPFQHRFLWFWGSPIGRNPHIKKMCPTLPSPAFRSPMVRFPKPELWEASAGGCIHKIGLKLVTPKSGLIENEICYYSTAKNCPTIIYNPHNQPSMGQSLPIIWNNKIIAPKRNTV